MCLPEQRKRKGSTTPLVPPGSRCHNHPWHPDPVSWEPAALFNGMVAPAINFTIKGVIWYQGRDGQPCNARAALRACLPGDDHGLAHALA